MKIEKKTFLESPEVGLGLGLRQLTHQVILNVDPLAWGTLLNYNNSIFILNYTSYNI